MELLTLKKQNNKSPVGSFSEQRDTKLKYETIS